MEAALCETIPDNNKHTNQNFLFYLFYLSINYCIEILKPLLPIDLPVFVDFVEREKVSEIISQGGQQMAFNRSEKGLKVSINGQVRLA